MRTLNDAAEYEFGSDRQDQIDAAHVILRAAFASAAMFWNELAFLHNTDDEDFLREPRLIEMRRALGAELNRMAKTLAQEDIYVPALGSSFIRPDLLGHPLYGDYVRNANDRFHGLVSVISSLNTRSRTVELRAPSTTKLSNT